MCVNPLIVYTAAVLIGGWLPAGPAAAGHVRQLQAEAKRAGTVAWGHWGNQPQKYFAWKSHSNRLIPIYTFGTDLRRVSGEKSVYRDEARLGELFGPGARHSVNAKAAYFDQTDVYRLQMDAIAAGKKHIVLVIFDGMDWQTTHAAAIRKTGTAGYREGRGSGLAFQDYRGTCTDFGFFVTSPHNDDTHYDVDAQLVTEWVARTTGGYDPQRGGVAPWYMPLDRDYLLGKNRARPHTVTDSAASATSMTAGIKTYNGAINVDRHGQQVEPIARWLQRTKGFSVGVVTSVPVSHATPAAAYANNVSRRDYQDIARDLIGLPSSSHRETPLAGVEVLLGGGWGEKSKAEKNQGKNYVPGNPYITAADVRRVDRTSGGRYHVVQRQAGVAGSKALEKAAAEAVAEKSRLLGLFGVKKGHLPFQTADGGFDPVAGVAKAESYTKADVEENPTLSDMTRAALAVLEKDAEGFWLMVEAGDVDWANHDNNIDNSIGAVLSGDDAFAEVVRWVEVRRCWDTTVVIVTADHGHFFVLRDPQALIDKHLAE